MQKCVLTMLFCVVQCPNVHVFFYDKKLNKPVNIHLFLRVYFAARKKINLIEHDLQDIESKVLLCDKNIEKQQFIAYSIILVFSFASR